MNNAIPAVGGMDASEAKARAIVYLVGAGPGDPGLLTLRGAECLRRAEVVVYDYLANPAILRHVPDSAELICLGRPKTGRALTPEEIVDVMLEEALRGKIVVRLKGGDPSVFGRGADETSALREAGIRYEVVPGITAGLAVGAYCEIPVTHHEDASAVAVIAGRERDAKAESSLDYGALAGFPGTLIFYMGVKNAPRWSRALIEAGKPAATPVAIVRWCSLPGQEMFRCTLETVGGAIAENRIRPPSLFIVGDVVDHAPEVSWFAARPMLGVRVLLTGPAHTSAKIGQRLSGLGAEAIYGPAIRITDPDDWTGVDAAIDGLDEFDWLVFSSSTGVDRFLGRLLERGGDLRCLGGVKLAAVGSGTAERLARYHLGVDLVPEEFNAESLARGLEGDAAAGRRFLLARANRGRQVLAEKLKAAGGQVEQVIVYQSVDVEEADADVASALAAGEIAWTTVTSPAIARSLVRLYGDALRQTRLASISPLTSAALRDLGYAPAAEASPHSMDGLAQAIIGEGQPEG